jgi:hypothetical protein
VAVRQLFGLLSNFPGVIQLGVALGQLQR